VDGSTLNITALMGKVYQVLLMTGEIEKMLTIALTTHSTCTCIYLVTGVWKVTNAP
jgi:hypothetical protein